ncbi:MAG: radical SAM protein, partial [Acidobacteria bacterium]|nr:radical SAM protein [Acidobacteriota bacterium]
MLRGLTGLYIHIPFCRAKCLYCSFNSQIFDEAEAARYARALEREVGACAAVAATGAAPIDSVYFGGGTPGIVPADQITGALAACRREFDFARDCEISLEANPGTLSREKLEAYAGAGINRISLGAQSFHDADLAALGRLHDSRQIFDTVAAVRAAGFENIGLDLMLGLPGQTGETWVENLEFLVRLGVPHVSVYMLELDSKVPLYQGVQR